MAFHPFPHTPHFASIVPEPAIALAYIIIIPPFHPDPPPPPHVDVEFAPPPHPDQDEGIHPYAEVLRNPRAGSISCARICPRVYFVLYNAHCVAVADVPPVHHARPHVPHAHPPTDAVAVVA